MTYERSELSPEWQRAFGYVEQRVGGRIVGAERQARWRPAWFLDVEGDDGQVRSVYFRGARGEAENGVAQLRHECRCLQLLERHGVPVPHVYGFCEEPEGIVMDRVAGRFNLATARDEAERVAVRNHYVEILARIHALPLDDFVAAGIAPLGGERELAMGDLPQWVAAYRKARVRPEPGIEFLLDWLERNVPSGRTRASFVVGDSGQFLFDEGRVTGLIDVELAYIGDPAHDLGALLSRDLSEPLGDLDDALARYERESGEPVDRRVVQYHAVRFGLVTPLATAAIVARPPRVADYVQYLAWYLVYQRCSMEIVAHLEGVEIAPAELPAEGASPWQTAHDALHERLGAFDAGDGYRAYQFDALARLAEYLRRADRYGADLLAADLDEASQLLGARPTDLAACDAQLEALVARNRGEHDAALLRYFVRRLQRHEFLLAPVMRELAGARMQTLRDPGGGRARA